ncbi:MAG: RluA family pseudouridine synthase [Myxococcales bacterium]|nr:RluA family pseudouridine synthase [Myxococcales bacterium]MCB9549615.1 RluA family pseudouridine synthase [Myxococcales bacterium]
MSDATHAAPADGRLDAAVRVAFGLTGGAAKRAIHSGKVSVHGRRVLDPGASVQAGDPLRLDMNAPRPARTEPLGVRLVYRDPHILVVDKPSGLLSAPLSTETEPTALDGALALCRGPRVAKVVHRLDKLTSGLMVFARSIVAARGLRTIIDEHRAKRVYFCVVQGIPRIPAATIVSDLMRDRGDGYRGSQDGLRQILAYDAPIPPAGDQGRQGVTRYRTVATSPERAALEVRIETGRTHQIRIHLSEIGHPVLGDQVYGRNSGAPRQALHAGRLTLPHPITGEELHFESPWPDDLRAVGPRGPGWLPASRGPKKR